MPEHDASQPEDQTPLQQSSPDEPFSADDFAIHDSEQPESGHLSTGQRTSQTVSQARQIDDLTLAEFLRATLVKPRVMLAALWSVLQPRPSQRGGRNVAVDIDEIDDALTFSILKPLTFQRDTARVLSASLLDRQFLRVVLYLLAFVSAVVGNLILITASSDFLARRSEDVQLVAGRPFLLAAFILWLCAELIAHWPDLVSWWQGLDRTARIKLGARAVPVAILVAGGAVLWHSTTVPLDESLVIVTTGVRLALAGVLVWFALDALRWMLRRMVMRNPGMFPLWLVSDLEKRKLSDTTEDETHSDDNWLAWYERIPVSRLFFALAATVLSVAVWFGSTGNRIPTPVIYAWLLSAVMWVLTFAPVPLQPLRRLHDLLNALQDVDWRVYRRVFGALAIIMLVGFAFRFDRLAEHPREMTDDHVELILDAGLVRDGLRAIFFANNGGREPFQMYTIAAASYLPGLGIDHFTIKFVAAVQSLLTIPLFFWLGYEITGGQNRRLRILVGLLAAAFLAVSYWHVAISRQALRLVLTPPITAIILIFLSRALRQNRRADFIITGLALGFGLYMYQAVRMLPVVIVVAIVLGIFFYARSWAQRRQYVYNLSVLVTISFMVFLPMFHYSLEQPELFWRRTTGRLLGDDIIQERNADGTIQMREATIEERFDAFRQNVPVLMSNIRDVLLMFNWKGDVASITGVPNYPALDSWSGALLIVGVAAWLSLMIRVRDPVHVLVPLAIFIMLLPSALSIAFPVENPSHTRTSGAMPLVYVVLAFPLALVVDQLLKRMTRPLGATLALVGCSALVLASYSVNTHTYFGLYPQVYADSFDPYSEPGEFLAGFAQSNGSYGNAFMIGYPHWWSHRAIGLAAGLETQWPNGIVSREEIPTFLENASARNNQFRFDPTRDVLFFYSPEDAETADYLKALFPTGREQRFQSYAQNNDFMWYMVPAMGQEGFTDWLRETSGEQKLEASDNVPRDDDVSE